MENNLILPALILVPFIAGFICWLVDKFDQQLPRWIASVSYTHLTLPTKA